MTHFSGAYPAKLDAKGRILIPKAFRDVLTRLQAEGAELGRLRPHDDLPCIEGWPMSEYIAHAEREITSLRARGEDTGEFEADFHWSALPLLPDSDGRLKLAQPLVDHGNLSGELMIMGSGTKFQIWAREAALAHRAQVAKNRGHRLVAPITAAGDA